MYSLQYDIAFFFLSVQHCFLLPLAFSKFLSCSQMPVVLDDNIIHGLSVYCEYIELPRYTLNSSTYNSSDETGGSHCSLRSGWPLNKRQHVLIKDFLSM